MCHKKETEIKIDATLIEMERINTHFKIENKYHLFGYYYTLPQIGKLYFFVK